MGLRMGSTACSLLAARTEAIVTALTEPWTRHQHNPEGPRRWTPGQRCVGIPGIIIGAVLGFSVLVAGGRKVSRDGSAHWFQRSDQ